jgi:hypothetical protein
MRVVEAFVAFSLFNTQSGFGIGAQAKAVPYQTKSSTFLPISSHVHRPHYEMCSGKTENRLETQMLT